MPKFHLALLALLMAGNLLAQLPLNFGFEHLSAEGAARPWGWNLYSYAPNVTFTCDEASKRSGKLGLKVMANAEADTGLFKLSYFVEPSQLFESEMQLDVFAQAKLSLGEAGIMVETYGQVDEEYVTLQSIKVPLAQEGKGWEKLTTNFTIGNQLHSLIISVYVKGHGEVQFDDLELRINGKVVNEVPVAPAFSEAQQQWITEHAKPFRTPMPSKRVAPRAKEFNDLSYFKELTAKASIIALGESTHGTSEFFSLKHRLLQYAVLEMGVRVFVLEDNQLKVERINQFVLHGKGTAEEVIKGLFGVWNRAEVLEMIKWLRAYNEANPTAKVEFVGIDIQDPELALDSLDHYLKRKAPRIHRMVVEAHKDFKAGWKNGHMAHDTTLRAWNRSATRPLRMLEAKRPEWLETAQTRKDSMEIEWAVQNARVIVQCIRSIRTGGMEGRDRAMALNTSWILKQRPEGTRMILWAHDFHVNIGAACDPDMNYFDGNSMGHFLAEEFGEQYFAFGLFTYQGAARGTVSYSDFTSTTFPIFTSPEGSLDQGLHEATTTLKSQNLILDLREVRAGRQTFDWLNIRRPVRYMGYVCEDYGFGGRYAIPYQFDAILFIDSTSPTKRIEPVK